MPQNLQVVSLPFTCYSPFPLFSCHIFLFCYFYCLLLSFQLLSLFLSFLVLQNLQVVSLPFTCSHPFPFFIVVSSFFLLLLSSFKFPSVLFLPLFSGASKPSSSRRCWLLPGRGVTQVPKKIYIYRHSTRRRKRTLAAVPITLLVPVIPLGPAGDDGAAETMVAEHILAGFWLC